MKKIDVAVRSFSRMVTVLSTLLFLLFCGQAFSQTRTITGRVTDGKGNPLQYVTVTVKGTSAGTSTDAEGRFSIKTDKLKPVLVISYVGYASQELRATGEGMTIVLGQNLSSLDTAVISVGYSTVRRRDITSSVGSVTGADIAKLPATNVEEALQGRIAGVNVIKNSGEPGTTANILIRGINSLNAGAPLYIVDGVASSGDNFNMEDVASVDVLKDASASAIYGSAAAGGVIIITTKKGQHSKPTINFTARYGTVRPELVSLLNRDSWLSLKRLINPGFLSGVANNTLPDQDWVHTLYGHGADEKYDLSISGGNDNATYLVSGFYDAQKGTYIDNSNYLTGFRVNSDLKVSNRIRVGEEVYGVAISNNPTADQSPNPPFRTVPTQAAFDTSNVAGGGYGIEPSSYYQGGNPIADELTLITKNRAYNFNGTVHGEVKLPFYLSFKATFNYSLGYSLNDQFYESYSAGAANRSSNYLQKTTALNTNVLTNYVLKFDHQFDKHSIQALAGFEQTSGQSDGYQVAMTNQAIQPNFTFINTSGSGLQTPVSGTYDPNQLVKSEFGQFFYNYDGKYYLSGSVRRDGDFTHFGPDHRFGVFPSGSIGWRMSEEKFFESALPVINDLKLRASYGSLGNNNIHAYTFGSYYSASNVGNTFTPGGNVYIGNSLSGISNADIKWETLDEVNIGYDASLLSHRLTVSMDWYNKRTINTLYNIQLPFSAGFGNNGNPGSILANVGTIQNRGFEFTLTYGDKKGDFSYNIGFNGAFNKNKIITLDGTLLGKLPDGSTDIGGGLGVTTGQNISLSAVGHSFGEFYGYKVDGIYQNTQQVAAHAQQAGQTALPGDLIFRDVDHSDTIDQNDRTFIGNPNPKFVYGFTANLRWKNIDVNMVFSGVAGVQLYNGTRQYGEYLFADGNTTSKVWNDSYLGSNGLTNQPRLGVQNGNAYNLDPNHNYTSVNSYFVENAGYVKLKNLQIGYTLPAGLLHTVGFSGLRVYLQGENVFTITKYTGIDPELYGSISAHGIDAPNSYAHTRTYSIGASVNF